MLRCCSLLEASSRRPDIQAALQASSDWQAYLQGPLAEANRRQDVMSWACGRPSKESLSTFKSTDDIIIDETEAAEEEGAVNRHLMRYNSLEDDDNDAAAPADKVRVFDLAAVLRMRLLLLSWPDRHQQPKHCSANMVLLLSCNCYQQCN